MKLHPIFTKEYRLWWGIMAGSCTASFYFFGFPTVAKNSSYILLILGTLLSSLLFGSVIYFFYWLFTDKLNNRLYMNIISGVCFLCLISYSYPPETGKSISLAEQAKLTKPEFEEKFDTISNSYSNHKFNIAFDAPDTWNTDQGLSEYTIFRTFQRDSLITFSIIAQNATETGNIVELYLENEEVMEDFLRTQSKKQANLDMDKVEISEGVLRNYPAIRSEFNYNLKGVEADVYFRSITYQMNRNNHLFTFTLTLPEDIYQSNPEYEQLFNRLHFLVDNH